MLRLKSEALRFRSEQLCNRGTLHKADHVVLLAQSEEMRTKAEQLQRESDALKAKLELIRRESVTAFVFNDFNSARTDNFAHFRPSSPSNMLLVPAHIPEAISPRDSREINIIVSIKVDVKVAMCVHFHYLHRYHPVLFSQEGLFLLLSPQCIRRFCSPRDFFPIEKVYICRSEHNRKI